jgi:hypothetical protein
MAGKKWEKIKQETCQILMELPLEMAGEKSVKKQIKRNITHFYQIIVWTGRKKKRKKIEMMRNTTNFYKITIRDILLL